jgi:hypothetical protein
MLRILAIPFRVIWVILDLLWIIVRTLLGVIALMISDLALAILRLLKHLVVKPLLAKMASFKRKYRIRRGQKNAKDGSAGDQLVEHVV